MSSGRFTRKRLRTARDPGPPHNTRSSRCFPSSLISLAHTVSSFYFTTKFKFISLHTQAPTCNFLNPKMEFLLHMLALWAIFLRHVSQAFDFTSSSTVSSFHLCLFCCTFLLSYLLFPSYISQTAPVITYGLVVEFLEIKYNKTKKSYNSSPMNNKCFIYLLNENRLNHELRLHTL